MNGSDLLCRVNLETRKKINKLNKTSSLAAIFVLTDRLYSIFGSQIQFFTQWVQATDLLLFSLGANNWQ